MEYNFTDAWILNSIVNSEKEGLGAELSEIIAYGDYANHAIFTLSELNNSIEKLYRDGLIEILENKNFLVTEIYKNWLHKKLEKKIRFSIVKIIEDTEKFLTTYIQKKSDDILNKKVNILEAEYLIAVKKYKNRFANL